MRREVDTTVRNARVTVSVVTPDRPDEPDFGRIRARASPAAGSQPDGSVMLNDAITARAAAARRRERSDRRDADRTRCPGEVVLRWLHDQSTTMRYELVDVSDGGYRVHTTLPVIPGTVAVLLRLLPKGEVLDQSAIVAWSNPSPDRDGYEIGLRVI